MSAPQVTDTRRTSSLAHAVLVLVSGGIVAVVAALVIVANWPGQSCGTDYGYFATPGDKVCTPTGSHAGVAAGFVLAALAFAAIIGAAVTMAIRTSRD